MRLSTSRIGAGKWQTYLKCAPKRRAALDAARRPGLLRDEAVNDDHIACGDLTRGRSRWPDPQYSSVPRMKGQ